MSSHSDKNCRRRSILKKNRDITIMTSSGHVTSSGTCPIERLSVGTIPLSVLDSEIFSSWRHWWRHHLIIFVATSGLNNLAPKLAIWNAKFDDVTMSGSTIRYLELFSLGRGTIVLKYQLILTKTVGEEAFWKCGQTDILTDIQKSDYNGRWGWALRLRLHGPLRHISGGDVTQLRPHPYFIRIWGVPLD